MALIGLPEAVKRIGTGSPYALQRALRNDGVKLVVINARALAVDDGDLQSWIDARAKAGYTGRGRPAKQKASA